MQKEKFFPGLPEMKDCVPDILIKIPKNDSISYRFLLYFGCRANAFERPVL